MCVCMCVYVCVCHKDRPNAKNHHNGTGVCVHVCQRQTEQLGHRRNRTHGSKAKHEMEIIETVFDHSPKKGCYNEAGHGEFEPHLNKVFMYDLG